MMYNVRSRSITVLVGFSVVLLAAGQSGLAQEVIPEAVDRSRLQETFHQYISTGGGPSPSGILRMDNNLEILFGLREPATPQMLQDRGVSALDSQLQLLRTWRLIRQHEDDERLQAAIPILDERGTSRLRTLTRALAERYERELRPELDRLLGRLSSRGWQDHSFTLLFSLVLDDLVWDELESMGRVDVREVTTETPFWAGTVWFEYPARGFSVGTNKIQEGDVALLINWSPSAVQLMGPLFDVRTMLSLWELAADPARRARPELVSRLSDFELFTRDGRLRVPRIQADADDPIYSAGRALARKMAGLVDRHLPLAELREMIRVGDDADRIVIAYHDLMWDLLGTLDRTERVRIPTVLQGEGDAPEVGDLLFVVERS